MMSINRSNSNVCPCQGCHDRVPDPNCHGTCERYKAWRAKLDTINEAERKHHQNNDTMSDAKKKAVWRSRRYSRQLTYSKSHKAD